MDASFKIREAKQSDKPAIQRYLSEKVLIHRHLDWRQPLDWLPTSDLLIYLNSRNEIDGLFCCTAEIDSRYWIRIFSCRNKETLFLVWHRLFEAFRSSKAINTSQLQLHSLAYLPWMVNLLELEGWKVVDTIVQLEWFAEAEKDLQNRSSPINIRRMRKRDLERTYQIDYSSFKSTWQQSFETFVHSFNESGYATVYEQDHRVVGFQLSTLSKQRAHLARIAVDHDFLRRGIGKALIIDFLRECSKQKIGKISVNTQNSNSQSISLYKKLGFLEIDSTFPIFQLD